MEQRTHADIPFAFFEYLAVYKRPTFGPFELHDGLFTSIFAALQPWNITLQNVSSNQNARNASEIWTRFTLLNGRLNLNVGLGSLNIHLTNPNWSEANPVARIAAASLEVLKKTARVEIETQRVSLGMHLTPKGGGIKGYVLSFSAATAAAILDHDVEAIGISMYRKESSWVVDKSLAYPQSLFVKIDHSFKPTMSFEEISQALKAEETAILDLLKLEIE